MKRLLKIISDWIWNTGWGTGYRSGYYDGYDDCFWGHKREH